MAGGVVCRKLSALSLVGSLLTFLDRHPVRASLEGLGRRGASHLLRSGPRSRSKAAFEKILLNIRL